MYDEAEDCLRLIIENDEENMAAWMQLATMFDNADMSDRAAPYVDKVIAMKRDQALQRKQARSTLPSLLPTSEPREQSLSPSPEEIAPISSMIDNTPVQKSVGKRNRRQAEEAEIAQRVQSTYLEMRRLRERLRLGETGVKNEWMEGARSLVDIFRKNRGYFPIDRNAKVQGLSRKERKARGGQRTGDTGMSAGRLQDLLGPKPLSVRFVT